MGAPWASRSPSASSTPSSASCCCAAWTRWRPSARRCRSRPRCSCSTTRRPTARPRRRSPIPRPPRWWRWRNGAARPRTTPRCCSAPAGATRCCSTRTRSCWPGATAALHAALEADPRAGAAGAALLRPDGAPQPSAWRFPTPGTALLARCSCTARLVVQSRGDGRARGRLGAVGRAARPPRRGGRAIGWLRPGVLRLLRRGRLLQAAARRRLAHAVRPGRARRTTTSSSRPGAVPGAAHRRALAQPRPLHAQAPLARRRPRRALAHRVDLRGRARPPRSRCRATTRAATPRTSAPRCVPAAARACARPRADFNRRRAGS